MTFNSVVIIGGSDPWVAEIVDCAVAQGLVPRIAPGLFPLGERDEFGDTEVIALESLDRVDNVFTGSDIDPALVGEVYSDYVLKPFRRLLHFQREAGLTSWISLVHPQSWVSPNARMGQDVFVGANASIGAFSSIGNHVRLNRNASIGHHVAVEEGVEIGPGAIVTSGCRIGPFSFIGAGAIVLNNVRVGAGSTVGAGSLVTRDVRDGAVVLGSPARERQ